MKKKTKIIVIACVTAIAVGVSVILVIKMVSKNQKIKAFEDMCDDISTSIGGLVAEHFLDEELVQSVDCQIESKVFLDKDKDMQRWIETYNTVIYVDDSFDDYSVEEQYETIDHLGKLARNAIEDEIDKKYPDHNEYRKPMGYPMEVYGKYVSVDIDENTEIKTTENTYGYATIVDNYYTKNGEDVYVKDQDGNWDGGYVGFGSWDTNDDEEETGSSVTEYDAILKYGSGTENILIFSTEEAMSRYMSALSNDNQGTLDEMMESGEVAITERGTKCNIVKRKLTKCQVKLLDGTYKGNTVWVVVEAVNEK